MKSLWVRSVVLIILTASKTKLFSQELGCWNSLNVNFYSGEKWSFSSEAQLRSLSFYKNFNYYEYKGIIGYKLIPNLQTSLVIGQYTTYSTGKTFQDPILAKEIRIALQLGLKNSLGKFEVDHRYRIEKRYYSTGAQGIRIRYRIGLSVPLDKKKLTSFSLSNEFLIAIRSGSAIIYDKNRINIAVTRKINKILSMQLGFLSQYDSKSVDEPGRNFLVCSMFLNLTKINLGKSNHVEN
jgi:hypothetical protein